MANPYNLIEGNIYNTADYPIASMIPLGSIIKIIENDILLIVTPYIRDRQNYEGIGVNLKTGTIVYSNIIPKKFKYKLIKFKELTI